MRRKRYIRRVHNKSLMKNPIPAFVIILILVSFLPISAQGTRVLEISSLVIKFQNTDAEFTVNYDIGTIPRMYILLMGGKSIEPKMKELFSNFDYEIIKMDQDKAILHVRNISRFEKGYYLHDSIGFGTRINTMIIYIPGDPSPAQYFGLNATKNTFYS